MSYVELSGVTIFSDPGKSVVTVGVSEVVTTQHGTKQGPDVFDFLGSNHVTFEVV